MLRASLPWIEITLEILTLVGLVVRRHLRVAVLLPVWLLAHLGLGLTLALRPALNTWAFWNAKELATLGLTILLGLEIAARLSTNLPGVRHTFRWSAVPLGLLSVAMLGSLVWQRAPVTTDLVPMLACLTAMLFISVQVHSIYFCLPLPRLYAVLLPGVAATCILYTVTWHRAVPDATVAAYINALAFAGFVAALCRAAWQREDLPDVPRDVLHMLWPWRAHDA